VAISLLKRKGDCFVASLLAMTTTRTVIASPPKAGVAISFLAIEKGLKAIFPGLLPYEIATASLSGSLAMTERGNRCSQ
jgi:hypothetical protein